MIEDSGPNRGQWNHPVPQGRVNAVPPVQLIIMPIAAMVRGIWSVSPAGQFISAANHSEPDVGFDSASESDQDDNELLEHDNKLLEHGDWAPLLVSGTLANVWDANV